jgi:hypothetical protein
MWRKKLAKSFKEGFSTSFVLPKWSSSKNNLLLNSAHAIKYAKNIEDIFSNVKRGSHPPQI